MPLQAVIKGMIFSYWNPVLFS
jgi:hypothetical protein